MQPLQQYNMNVFIEKAFLIILGAVAGSVVGMVILSLQIPFILNDTSGMCVEILSAVIGVLVTIINIYRNREKIAKKGEALRNETVALMTHEMRTSLTSTSWSIGMILKNYDSQIKDEDKKILHKIEESIHNTVLHTVNLLDVSLLDIGKLKISLDWVNLSRVGDMIKEVIEKYKMGVENKEINIISNINLDKDKEVEVDSLRLRIILENLLENAIQYSKNDAPADFKKEIYVDISNTKSILNISVGDNGIGIPEKEQAKIFEEFYRASNARKKLSSGSGIGLHMCSQYVKAHNGTINFTSKEGVSSKFFITIPLKTNADPKEFLQKI